MKQGRPKIRPPKQVADRFLEVIAIISLMSGIILVVQAWPTLPATIPTHFNAYGQADGWGSKYMIWLMPGMSVVLVPAMLFFRRFPWLSNMPIELTEKNTEYQYRMFVRLLSFLSCVVSLMFLNLSNDTIRIVNGGESLLGWRFIPIFLVGTLAPIIWYLFKAFRER